MIRRSYRAATLVTTLVAAIWILRFPVTFFDFTRFSYVVYLCFAATVMACMAGLMAPANDRVRVVMSWRTWLLIATVAVAAFRGMANAGGIPYWMAGGDEVDYTAPWVYFRTFALPALLFPVLALLIAEGVRGCDRLTTNLATSVHLLVLTVDALVFAQILLSGNSLLSLAQAAERDEHLNTLGLHANDFGTFLAIAYALLLGLREGAQGVLMRRLNGAVLAATALALVLTFSRGSYLAFAVVNIVFFLRSSGRQKVAWIAVAIVLAAVVPEASVERMQFGWKSRDLNQISAGRVDDVWRPLVEDIETNVLFGHGLQSILWTDAQRGRRILPVGHAHNAYLDSLLDVGLVGSVVILGWYFHLWAACVRLAKRGFEPMFRAWFSAAQLALAAFLTCGLTNDRLTPTSSNCLIWIAAGVVLGGVAAGSDLPEGQRLTVARSPARFRRLWTTDHVRAAVEEAC